MHQWWIRIIAKVIVCASAIAAQPDTVLAMGEPNHRFNRDAHRCDAELFGNSMAEPLGTAIDGPLRRSGEEQ
jgi:hypothetical protein